MFNDKSTSLFMRNAVFICISIVGSAQSFTLSEKQHHHFASTSPQLINASNSRSSYKSNRMAITSNQHLQHEASLGDDSDQHLAADNIIDESAAAAHVELEFLPEQRGSQFAADYRLYFKEACSDGYVSPWHDIPLYVNANESVVNMVLEIPRWSQAKMEIATKERLNPIRQDQKDGELRFVHNCFPYVGHICNYGALPQTWEDHTYVDPHTGTTGDNDPIDICEIGHRIPPRGSVMQVKILGALALIDKGETDWKLIAIDLSDPIAKHLDDIQDVDLYFPGLLNATRDWFRIYKTPSGHPPNRFGYDGQYRNRAETSQTVAETHRFWKRLMEDPQRNSELDTHRVHVDPDFTTHSMTPEEAKQVVESNPLKRSDAQLPNDVHRWHYLDSRTHMVV